MLLVGRCLHENYKKANGNMSNYLGSYEVIRDHLILVHFCIHSFYKNEVYKNIEVQNHRKLRIILE